MKPGTHQTSSLGRVKYRLHQWLRYGVFNEIIVSSQVIAQAVQRFGIPARRVKIIPNGVDLNRFHPIEDPQERLQLRQSLGFSSEEKLVLFVGSMSYRKGVDLLLQAWPEIEAAHPCAKLVLVGPQDRTEQFTALFNEILREHASDRVLYIEPVTAIEAYMQIADILVFPSRLEGMPNVVVEGMACGLPCVLTPFDGLPETFGQPGLDYLLTSFQPEKLAADINALLADPERQIALGRAALLRARTVLNAEKSLDQHAEIYHTLASNSRRRNR